MLINPQLNLRLELKLTLRGGIGSGGGVRSGSGRSTSVHLGVAYTLEKLRGRGSHTCYGDSNCGGGNIGGGGGGAELRRVLERMRKLRR